MKKKKVISVLKGVGKGTAIVVSGLILIYSGCCTFLITKWFFRGRKIKKFEKIVEEICDHVEKKYSDDEIMQEGVERLRELLNQK